MTQDVTDQITRYWHVVKNRSIRSAAKYKQIMVTLIIPQSKKCAILGIGTYKEKLAPHIYKVSSCVSHEIIKIHNKQNWLKRCSSTMLDSAAGLGMAMLTARIMQNYVEVKELGNLWGILATRPVVSESTYEVLNFAIEFFVALIVFTITEHYLDEYRQRKNATEMSAD